MRQIVLDTETTGISHQAGHRIIEIGCVEMLDRKITGAHFHVYINPARDVEEGAFRVHGISTEFLQDKPFFIDIADDFLTFVTGAELIIHNAPFDTGFLNAELTRLNFKQKISDVCTVFDTLAFAREKHPGQRVNLDALCKRYDINNSNRQLHGALLDAELLALVYLAMTGGQGSLFEEERPVALSAEPLRHEPFTIKSSNTPILVPDAAEMKSHTEFLDFLRKKSGVDLWQEEDIMHD